MLKSEVRWGGAIELWHLNMSSARCSFLREASEDRPRSFRKAEEEERRT